MVRRSQSLLVVCVVATVTLVGLVHQSRNVRDSWTDRERGHKGISPAKWSAHKPVSRSSVHGSIGERQNVTATDAASPPLKTTGVKPRQTVKLAAPSVVGKADTNGNGSMTPTTDDSSGDCDDECRRFMKHLDTDWPADKPRAAIYILTQSKRLHYLESVIASLDKYFNGAYRYPLIIFHEEDFVVHREGVRNFSSSAIFFQTVAFKIPDFLEKPVPLNIDCTSPISYRHMCRFNAHGVFREPVIRTLQYYWRLDDDSLLLDNVTYDVFRFMQSRGLAYGYVWRHLDALVCVRGLWEATRSYIQTNRLQTFSFERWKSPWLYYNNFEISQVAPWTSRQYTDYIDYIDRLGGIYYHRWGDAPIRGIAVSMFLSNSSVHKFSDINYQHGTFVQRSQH